VLGRAQWVYRISGSVQCQFFIANCDTNHGFGELLSTANFEARAEMLRTGCRTRRWLSTNPARSLVPLTHRESHTLQDPPIPPSTDSSPPPSPPTTLPPSSPSHYSSPPFHTHAFVTALEKSFPTPVARSLMTTTKALLIDRINNVRREGLTVKDLDNVCSFRFLMSPFCISTFK
jgi:hypothetical protein